MKEIKLEGIDSNTDLNNKVWQILNEFRGTLGAENYPVVLFLLSLLKDGIFDEFNISNSKNLYEHISNSVSKLDKETAEAYETMLEFYKPLINNYGGLIYLIQSLKELNQNSLKENFAVLFENLLYEVSKTRGRFAGESLMPIEISRFICGLVELPANAKIYNPFAGLASFGIFFKEGENYLGQEIDKSTWALGLLRLLASKRLDTSRFIVGDSINNWNPIKKYRSNKPVDILKYPSENDKFDLIIASPPFGMRISHPVTGNFGLIRNAEHFLIEKGLEDLKEDGKLIAVVSNGRLSSGGSEGFLRKYLIDNDLLEMVISFPGGLLSNTAIPFTILILNKDKKQKGIVKFIDAKDCIKKHTIGGNKIAENSLMQLVKSNQNYDAIRFVPNVEIINQDYNLSIPRYFQIDYEGVKLGEIVEIIRGKRFVEGEKGKFIRIRDLSDGKKGDNLIIEDIDDVLIPRHTQRIDESCLILAIRWKTLKPTYFKYTGTPIFLTLDTVALRANETILDIDYLINELNADYVIKQIEAFRIGDVIPSIRKDDLLNVKITLPSLEEQRAKLSGLKESMVKMKLLEAERNALAHGLGNLVYENFASVKHSLGKPLMNIGSSLRNIEKALAKLDKDWETIKLSERLDVTLKDSFDSVYSNLETVHSILKNNEKEFDVNNYKLEDLDILKFIKSFIKSVKSAQKSNVTVKDDINPDITKYYSNKLIINANAELIKIALNNIVENANKHAFTDDNQNYILDFKIGFGYNNFFMEDREDFEEELKTFIKIEISNNGNPFPKNFGFKKFIRKNSFAGTNGNTGIGGYDINEIVKYHKGELLLINNKSSELFVTSFSIFLPLDN